MKGEKKIGPKAVGKSLVPIHLLGCDFDAGVGTALKTIVLHLLSVCALCNSPPNKRLGRFQCV